MDEELGPSTSKRQRMFTSDDGSDSESEELVYNYQRIDQSIASEVFVQTSQNLPQSLSDLSVSDENWVQTDLQPSDWLPTFTKQVGTTLNPEAPIDVFSEFFNDEYLSQIIVWTNKCGQIKYENFRKVTLCELKIVIGGLILMGVCKLASERSHWSTRRFLGTPELKQVITRDRFWEIRRSLRFYDYSIRTSIDPLFKVRSLLDRISTVSRNLYTPSKNLSIDESLVAFKGKFGFKQIMPKKAAHQGLKFFIEAESKTGYMLNWHLFTQSNVWPDPITQNIVLDLTSHIENGSGHHIFTDSFYYIKFIYIKFH